jgi:hypothetical protein
MRNTDRIVGYDKHGSIEFVEIPGNFTTKGKEWARGYAPFAPNPFYDVGTGFGKHPFDFRALLRCWDLLPALFGDLIARRNERG